MKHFNETHGMSKTPEYRSWMGMKDRCYNEKNKKHHRYGGRGISVCERWRNSFEDFLNDMGPKPSKDASIDRIDNDKGYSPENCRWATQKEQQNNRGNNALLTCHGETLTISQWAMRSEVSEDTIFARKKLGWTDEDAISKPLFSRKKKGRGVTKEKRRNGSVGWKAYAYKANKRIHLGSFDTEEEALEARANYESFGS